MIFFRRRPEYDFDKEMTLRMRWLIWTSGVRGAFVLVILLISGLAWWKGHIVYQWVKEKRAASLVTQAETARAHGDFKEASSKLGQAVALLPRHPATLRAVARYQLAMHDLSALRTYLALLKTGQATTEDQIQFACEAFRLGHPEFAESIVKQLSESKELSGTSILLALQAQQLVRFGYRDRALDLARKAAEAPDHDDHHAYAPMILARMLIQSSAKRGSSSDQLNEGIDLLGKLASRPDQTGLEALDDLAALSQQSFAAEAFLHRDMTVLISTAESRPDADAALKVRLWNLRVAAEPTKRAEIMHELFERVQHDPSDSLRLEAARCLNRYHLNKEVLELALPARSTSTDWCLVYLDALSDQGNWEQVYQELTSKTQKLPLSKALTKLFEFRSASETGRHPDPAEAWQDIQSVVRSESLANEHYIAAYAERVGYPNEALVIYRRLLRADTNHGQTALGKLNGQQRLDCYLGLLRSGAVSMPLEELSQVLEQFTSEFPEIDEGQNDNAYIHLLRGEDLEKAQATARMLLLKKPELLIYRTTVALASLRSAKPQEALAVYEDWTTDWNTAPDRCKAVYTCVLKANGRSAEAEKIAHDIHVNALRPEERQLAGLPTP